jgi:multidrug resistance efflux pump
MPATVSLFRPAAVEARSLEAAPQALDLATPLVTSWSWGVFVLAAAMLAIALLLGGTLRVEVTGRAAGAVVPMGGVRPVDAAAAGVVAEVFRMRGDRVRTGDPILRIESAQAKANVVAADGALEAERMTDGDDASFARQLEALHARAAIEREQIDSAARSVALREETMRRRSSLHDAGLASETDVSVERDALEAARRQLGAARAQAVQTSQQVAALEQQRDEARRARETRVAQATAQRDAARVPLDQLVVRASANGTIEALAAHPGNVVQPGASLGRIVPDDAPLRVVCFLGEDDRRFVHPGDAARLEVDELPKLDFGTLPARVLRISRDLATDADVHEVLPGADAHLPVYRVELEPSAARPLRAGMLLHARFVLRRERPLTLLLAPLRRWMS